MATGFVTGRDQPLRFAQNVITKRPCVAGQSLANEHQRPPTGGLEDPAMLKIPSQLLDMSRDGNAVSSKEGKMFLNNCSPVNIDILESRHPSNLVFQPLEHGTKQA